MAENPFFHNGGSNLHIMQNNEYANLLFLQSVYFVLVTYSFSVIQCGYYSIQDLLKVQSDFSPPSWWPSWILRVAQ